ncbi:MAG TPA: beta-ketoacyl synthase N-terminal-like domain-containing protein [Kofleriaceae bacterium]|nr:beta-ketoacyl synthase N-terminal-like domain-containing protein [Kofleriaceae bacterium]
MESIAATPSPLSRALDTINRLKAQLAAQRTDAPVAVVGVGLRFPGGIDTIDAYWQALAERRDLVRELPPARRAPFGAAWDAVPHKAGFLDEITGFDAGFFGISPREARAMDPQHRLLLEVAWEALEHAALPPDQLRGTRTGLYIGITGQSDYRDWQPGEPDAYWATGNGHCFAAGRLAYAMGFHGPAIAVDTACSSGLVAVHLAAQALRRGECEVAIAGGVNLILSPRSTRLMQETRALSPDGLCRTFDARANGYTRGEGCGVVVLKKLDAARRDGDRVLAVIHGSAINQDGRSSGFTAPNVLAQISLIEAALADASATPADIGLVEAHGTGTSLGDPIEIEAIACALGRKNGGAPLYVGSAKTNLGHLEAAAGLAGLIKAIACCAHGAIPALVHFETLNPRIDLSGTAIAMPTALTAWQPAMGKLAGVSAFGISGTNAHVIVGPGEPRPVDRPVDRVEVAGFELAARTPSALRAMAARDAAWLAGATDDAYAAYAYTATYGRARHAVRAWVAAADRGSAIAALRRIADGAPVQAPVCAPVRADEAPAMPRQVIGVPSYPWERERHAPEAAVASPIAEAAVANPAAIIAADDAMTRVRGHVAAMLGYASAAGVDDDASLFDLGMDSLMAVDLAHALSVAFGKQISLDRVFEHASVRALTALVDDDPAEIAPAEIASAEIASIVEAPVVDITPRLASVPAARRVGFLFSCQGGQHFGMGRELYDTEPVFRDYLDRCDRILAPLLGGSLVDVMLRGDDPDAIHETRVTQPALVALELALAELWRARGVEAAAVIGHSLGEVAAAIYAGVLELDAGLTLVAHRARLMQSTAPGAMLAVSATLAEVTAQLAGTALDVAAINGPAAIVVSGDRAEVDALAARLAALGIQARAVAVTIASHSRLMAPIADDFRAAIAGFSYTAPRMPIIGNLAANLAGNLAANLAGNLAGNLAANLAGNLAGRTHDADYWCRHLVEPVRFTDGLAALAGLGCDAYLELGPGAALLKLAATAGRMPPGGGAPSLKRGTSDRAAIEAAAAIVGGLAPITQLRPRPAPISLQFTAEAA